ncbi:MAG: hypothetical protein RL557_981 [archaeon]|jgi:hypothetical protein
MENKHDFEARYGEPRGLVKLSPTVRPSGPFLCYSDASMCERGSAYGIIVINNAQVFRCESGMFDLEADNSIAAELLAMTKALSFVPNSVGGTSYSDLENISSLLLMETNSRKYDELVTRLNDELGRTNCIAKYLPKNLRDDYYFECHKMARKARRKCIY